MERMYIPTSVRRVPDISSSSSRIATRREDLVVGSDEDLKKIKFLTIHDIKGGGLMLHQLTHLDGFEFKINANERAVSQYLQTAFIKEADSGRSSLSLEKLLIGKSRKEASRMFFETLVLKTRDYIHVEQRNPFGDVAIRPRTRLMKSDF